VLDGFCRDFNKGEIISIVGPNGCGKSTLLNIISGIVDYEGEIEWNSGRDGASRTAYIFQDSEASLFPWLPVWKNIGMPLIANGSSQDRVADAVRSFTSPFLDDKLLLRYPYQLSGGQQQLVAILQGAISDAGFIMLDEPFAALDYKRRLNLASVLNANWQDWAESAILVSHHPEEAVALGHRILLCEGPPLKVVKELGPRQPSGDLALASEKERKMLSKITDYLRD